MRTIKRFGTAQQKRQNIIKSIEIQIANNHWREEWVLDKRHHFQSTRRLLGGDIMSQDRYATLMSRTQRELGALTKEKRRLTQRLTKLAV